MTEPRRRPPSALERLGIQPPRRRRMVEIVEPVPESPPNRNPWQVVGSLLNQPIDPNAPVEVPEGFDPEAFADGQAEIEASRPEVRETARRQEESARIRADLARQAERERVRDAAYDRGLVEGLVVDSDALDALQRGTVQGLTLGHFDELQGLVRSGNVSGEDYERERDRFRADYAESQQEEPGWLAGGEILGGSLPALAIPGARGASLARRVAGAGATGLGLGLVEGEGRSNANDVGGVLRDTARGGAIGLGFGVGSQLIGEGLGAGYRALRGAPEGTPSPGADFTPEQQARIRQDPELRELAAERERLEDLGAMARVRSTADSAALTDVRRAADYHGPGGEGYRGLARDLDTYGVMGRRSLSSADQAQARARVLAEDAGERIGGVQRRMQDAALPEPELPGLDVPNDPARVTFEQTAQRLRQRARDMIENAATPAEVAEGRAMLEFAESYATREPATFDRAKRVLDRLDEEAGWGARYPGAPGSTPDNMKRVRTARTGVRADMDDAVQRVLGPEELTNYRRDRGAVGIGRSVDAMSERGAAREALNLQAGLGDTIAIQNAMAASETIPQAIKRAIGGVIVNRYLRGRGHAAMSTLRAMQSDALAAQIVRRLNAQESTAHFARFLEGAAQRGPRSFGVALSRLIESSPEAARVTAQSIQELSSDPYEDLRPVEAEGDADSAPEEIDAFDDPYADLRPSVDEELRR